MGEEGARCLNLGIEVRRLRTGYRDTEVTKRVSGHETKSATFDSNPQGLTFSNYIFNCITLLNGPNLIILSSGLLFLPQ